MKATQLEHQWRRDHNAKLEQTPQKPTAFGLGRCIVAGDLTNSQHSVKKAAEPELKGSGRPAILHQLNLFVLYDLLGPQPFADGIESAFDRLSHR